MGEQRSAEEIRRALEAERAEFDRAVEDLRVEIAEATDWRRQLHKHRKAATVAAASVGLVIGGSLSALRRLTRRFRRR